MTLGRKLKEKINVTVGPGAYDTDGGILATQYSSMACSMRGKSKDIKPEYNLGPGQYNVLEKDFGNDGAKYSMRSRFEETVDTRVANNWKF